MFHCLCIFFQTANLKYFFFLPRSDAETKRALEELAEKLNEAQKQEMVRTVCL